MDVVNYCRKGDDGSVDPDVSDKLRPIRGVPSEGLTSNRSNIYLKGSKNLTSLRKNLEEIVIRPLS